MMFLCMEALLEYGCLCRAGHEAPALHLGKWRILLG